MDDILKEARDAFDEAVEAESDNRARQLDDLRFARLGDQWDEAVKNSRDRENRPCLTINRMPSFIRQVVNDARMNKPAIKCHPVDDSSDPETAELLNGLIRNIEVSSNADVAYDTATDFAVSSGVGYFRVDIDYASDDVFEKDIQIERVANPFSIYGDPRSTAADSSDWNVGFVTDVLTHKEFEASYPDAAKSDWESDYSDIGNEEWFADNSVRVAEYWTREEVDKEILLLSNGEVLAADVFAKHAAGYMAENINVITQRTTKSHKVMQRIVTGAEVLEETEWAGRFIPIIPVYGEEVIVEGKRHFISLIHFAKDAQSMYNYWRTAATELVALAPKAPFIGAAGAFDGDPNWLHANTKTLPYLEYTPVAGAAAPQRQPFAGVPAGAIQESLSASDDMKSIMGLYDASLGARSNETSGVAINARQREGDVSTYHFIDNLSRAIRHAGRVIVDLIPHVYTDERIVRVLGEDDTPNVVPVNQEFSVPGQNGQPQPRIYDLTTGKYDVTVKAGPSFTTKREEAATQMTELMRTFPQVAPLIGDLVAKNLDWPGADEIAKRLKTLLPEKLQDGDPQVKQMQQAIQQLQAALQASQQESARKDAELQLKAKEVDIKGFEAETDRLEAEVKSAGMMQPPTLPTPNSII